MATHPVTTAVNKHRCARCDEILNDQRMVWLELSFVTGKFSKEGTVPVAESQGCFPFGSACAAAVIKAGGRCRKMKGAA